MNFEINGKKYKVIKPNRKIEDEANKTYLSEFNRALKDGCMLAASMDSFLKEHKIWDVEKENKIAEMRSELGVIEKILTEEGGISLDEAKIKAEEAQMLRMQILNTVSYKKQYDDITVEKLADDAKFNHLVSQCTLNEDGTKAFASYEAFMNSEDEDLGGQAAYELGRVLYGDLLEFYSELPENKFLIDYGFIDKNLKPIGDNKEEIKFKPFTSEAGEPVTPMK